MPHQLGEISQYIYDNLTDGKEITLSEICERFNWPNDVENNNKARSYILSLRKRLEKETGDLLKCRYGTGTYYLVSFSKDDVKTDASTEVEKRKQRAINTVDTFGRSVVVIISNYPELTDGIRGKVSDLLYEVLDVERKTNKKLKAGE